MSSLVSTTPPDLPSALLLINPRLFQQPAISAPHLHCVDCQLRPIVALDRDHLKKLSGPIRTDVEDAQWRLALKVARVQRVVDGMAEVGACDTVLVSRPMNFHRTALSYYEIGGSEGV